jgi:dihydrofolate reductase
MTNGKVVVDITTSVDGFVAGPNDGVGNGLGDRGERLHEWVYDLATWREPHGLTGGEMNRDAEILDEAFKTSGAIIVGKRMYDNAEGWGDNPPFNMPVFVLTHDARDPETRGKTTFTFVTDGIASAFEQARAAAGDKNVGIGGGANTIQQFINAGLVDELQIHIAPILLGDGIRLFDQIDTKDFELEKTRVVDSPRVTHLRFRFLK